MHIHAADIAGLSRLVIAATTGITDLVETMHHTIANGPRRPATSATARTRGITGFVYGSVRGVTNLVGGTIDLALKPVVAAQPPLDSTFEREAVRAALNGVLGDHLAETRNPLAVEMTLRSRGTPETGKVLVFVHGLCMNDRHWQRGSTDYGAVLAEDLGYTPLFLYYNSGLHISTNGRAFAEMLERALAEWPAPVETLAIVGHSMGGLVARSAVEQATDRGMRWPARLHRMVFLGTPHHGAPLERGGAWIDTILGATPYVAPFARIGQVRSAGITDLRHGLLSDDEWQGKERFSRPRDGRRSHPLPDGVACYAAAAVLDADETTCKGRLLGDGLVPLESALGRHRQAEQCLDIPTEQQWIGRRLNHLGLLSSPDVLIQLRQWLA